MRQYIRVTPEQEKKIIELFPTHSNKEISAIVNMSKEQVRGVYRRNGLKRTDDSRFKPGQTPPNKGKKMDPEVKERIKHTFFKPGNEPHNTKSNGQIVKRSCGYSFIRVSKSKWEVLHRYIWISVNGKIPKGLNIVFKDGNVNNCKIENLELISDAELLERNSITKYPMDLQQAIKSLNKLNKQIKNNGKK